MTVASTQRYDGIQVLRLAAALAVVICHSAFYTTERLGVPIAFPNGASGVDVFFVISGFVMIVSSERLVGEPSGWREFAYLRLARIVPLYWIATTVKLLALLIAPAVVFHAELDWPSIIRSYFFLPSRNVDGEIAPLLGVGWTLFYEMFFYLVFAIALFLKVNRYALVSVVFAICCIGFAFRPTDFPPWMVYFDPLVLEFLFGMLIARAALKGFSMPRWLGAALIVVGTVLLLNQLPLSWGWRAVSAGIPSAMIVLGVVALEPVWHAKVPRILMFGGAASYALYLFHSQSAQIAPTLFAKLGYPNAYLSTVLGVVIAFVVSAIVHLMIEKPIGRMLRWSGPRSATAAESNAGPVEQR